MWTGPISPTPFLDFSATSLGTFNVNAVTVVRAAQPQQLTSPSPSPAPTNEADSEPQPSETSPAPAETSSPTPVATSTATAQPSPSEMSGTVKLDGEQFGAITVGLVLILLLLAAIFAAQMRRP